MNTRRSSSLIVFAGNERKRIPLRKAIFRAGVICFSFYVLSIVGLVLRDYWRSDNDWVYALYKNKDTFFVGAIPFFGLFFWWYYRILASRTVGPVKV
jgi:hypothetical protein